MKRSSVSSNRLENSFLPYVWFQSLMDWLRHLPKTVPQWLLHQDDLLVREEIKDGFSVWYVMDTATGQSSYFTSVTELLHWIDTRHGSR